MKDENYNIRLNIKKEEPLVRGHHMVDDFLKDYSEKNKHFRYKKRYSFITKDRLYRIDLTVVKSTKKFKGRIYFEKTFQKANILNNPEKYELEIEFIGWEKEVGIPKLDVLYQKIKQGHILPRPSKETQSNLHDPLNLGIPIFEAENERTEGVLEDGTEYGFDSPRWSPVNEYKPYTISSIRYSKDDYRKLIGKFTQINDAYFTDTNIDTRVRDSLKEYYKRGKKVTIISNIYEEMNETDDYIDTIAEIDFIHQIGEYKKLKVSLKYLYSDYFTVEEEKIIESDMSEEDISKEILLRYPSHMNMIEDEGIVSLVDTLI